MHALLRRNACGVKCWDRLPVHMNREAFAIRLSAGTNAFFGILGTGFGIWLSSDAILLDGVFNWISFVMALLSLRVARVVKRPPDETFPFGYAAFEPLMNTVKALIVLGVSVFALIGAVQTLFSGGRALDVGPALVYAGVAIVGCFALWLVQRRIAKQTESPLVRVDATNWFVNGAISSAVGAAFLVAMLIRGTSLDSFVPYVDSALVVLLVVLTVPIPLRMAAEGLGELLGYAPPKDVRETAHTLVDEATRGGPVTGFSLRTLRVGRTVFLLAEARVPGSVTVADVDPVRKKIRKRLEEEAPHLVMDVVFRPV